MSRTMNKKATKFTVGQMVKVCGNGLATKGMIGRISSITSNKTWPYFVTFKRERGEYAANEIELA